MSKHSTSRSPASSASASAPRTPPAGPESTVSAPCAAALAASVSPPEDCITSGPGQPHRVGLRAEVAQVGTQQRGHRRVHLGRRRALVLAERPHQLVGERDVHRGCALRDQRSQLALVLGVGVGVQQRHRDRLGLGVRQFLHQRSRRLGVERAQGTVRGHALRRPEAQLLRRQRRGAGLAQPVQVRPRLASERHHVGEALGGHQRRARRWVGLGRLQQGVGRHRHPVREALHLVGLGARGGEHRAHRFHHPAGLLLGGAGDLRGVRGALIRDQHRVGEGPPDVYAQQHPHSLRVRAHALGE